MLFAGAALLAASLMPATGHAARHHQDRRRSALFRPVRRRRQAGRRRHQALHEAARRHRRRQENRDHPQGRRRHRPAGRQAAGGRTGRARQGRHPRRLAADAERDRRLRRVGRSEEGFGHHECGDLDHRRQVALLHARLVHAADGHDDARQLGGQERHQEGLHDGVRLRARPRLRSRLHRRLQGRRRRDRRLGAHGGRQSGLLGLRPARQGPQSGSDLRVHSGRRAAGGARQGVSPNAASTPRRSR